MVARKDGNFLFFIADGCCAAGVKSCAGFESERTPRGSEFEYYNADERGLHAEMVPGCAVEHAADAPVIKTEDHLQHFLLKATSHDPSAAGDLKACAGKGTWEVETEFRGRDQPFISLRRKSLLVDHSSSRNLSGLSMQVCQYLK